MSKKLTRKSFLKLLAAGMGSAPFIGNSFGQSGPRSVIIVGGGIAGLAANDVLRAAGVHTILLEARSRIGGRIWTDSEKRDLGASWIHGRTGNPLMELVRRTGARTFSFNYDNIWRYDQRGAISDSAERRIEGDMDDIEDAIEEAQSSASISAALSSVTGAEIKSLSASRRNGARYAVSTGIVHEYAEDPKSFSLRHFDDGAEKVGGDLLLPNGYADLLGAQRMPSESYLNCVVSQIAHSLTGVTVTTSRGNFTAQAAIVTLPLGVLKSNSVRFVPALPLSHSNAINRIGFGTLNKIYLTFPQLAWPRDPHLFGYVGNGLLEECVNLFPFTGRPVLLGFNADAIARNSESSSDSQLVAGAMAVLRNMFGRSLLNPISSVVTRWSRDPFARGSYSCLAPGSSPMDRSTLAMPISPRL